MRGSDHSKPGQDHLPQLRMDISNHSRIRSSDHLGNSDWTCRRWIRRTQRGDVPYIRLALRLISLTRRENFKGFEKFLRKWPEKIPITFTGMKYFIFTFEREGTFLLYEQRPIK